MAIKKITPSFTKENIDKNALSIINKLLKNNFQAYLVGGCVRDLLFGQIPKDFDITTNATPEQVRSLFNRSRIIGRRFRLVHILFGARDFIEVSTFRSGCILSSEKNIKIGNKLYGTIEQDVLRRDLSINALYYDVKANKILDFVGGIDDIKHKRLTVIGDIIVRYEEDPVRMLRTVRFLTRFDLKITQIHKNIILEKANLLANISPSRLYDESYKLFHNSKALQTFTNLVDYGLLKYLFPNTQYNDFIANSLNNTATRIINNKRISPAFFISVFLWQILQINYNKAIKSHKPSRELFIDIAQQVIITQQQSISFAKYIRYQVLDIWLLQNQLVVVASKKDTKSINNLLANKRFRAAYDFLLLRAYSIDTELVRIADFWTKAQLKTHKSKHKSKYKKV